MDVRLPPGYAPDRVGHLAHCVCRCPASPGSRIRTPRVGHPPSRGFGMFVCLNLSEKVIIMGSVVKKRRKRMSKKKHRKMLKRTRVERRNKK